MLRLLHTDKEVCFMKKTAVLIAVMAAAVLLATLLVLNRLPDSPTEPTDSVSDSTVQPGMQVSTTQQSTTQQSTTVPFTVQQPTTIPATTESPVTQPLFQPEKTADSDPENWNVKWELQTDGRQVESFLRQELICFGEGSDYFALPGIATFRGSNYRQDASYGTADIQEGVLTQLAYTPVGALSAQEWNGCGWTGQPLVVQWDEQSKAIMNLYPEKREKEGLVEVIYTKMDGQIHFLDMEDGSATRDPVYIGMVFKGSGAIDPRGYPLLYVGAGLVESGQVQQMYIISLIDGSILWSQSGYDSFALRGWYAFDSSPLIHGQTDTLIWPGESGVLYSIKLNTQYDKEAGTISVAPENTVKARYSDTYSQQWRYLGYEASAVAVENYLYLGDNAGMLFCVDLNTMELVWAQDVLDDINATPLFEWGADGRGYLYVSPSLDYYNGGKEASLPICKVDAQTGQILWKHDMLCVTPDGSNGGTLASPLLGREGSDIEGLILFMVGHSEKAWMGTLVALDKETGELVWEYKTKLYAWASPIAIYTPEGKSYIFQSDAIGNISLLEGTTGNCLYSLSLGQIVEASPVAFEDRIVLGTRQGIHVLQIS